MYCSFANGTGRGYQRVWNGGVPPNSISYCIQQEGDPTLACCSYYMLTSQNAYFSSHKDEDDSIPANEYHDYFSCARGDAGLTAAKNEVCSGLFAGDTAGTITAHFFSAFFTTILAHLTGQRCIDKMVQGKPVKTQNKVYNVGIFIQIALLIAMWVYIDQQAARHNPSYLFSYGCTHF